VGRQHDKVDSIGFGEACNLDCRVALRYDGIESKDRSFEEAGEFILRSRLQGGHVDEGRIAGLEAAVVGSGNVDHVQQRESCAALLGE
jgi:hypothetical protein